MFQGFFDFKSLIDLGFCECLTEISPNQVRRFFVQIMDTDKTPTPPFNFKQSTAAKIARILQIQLVIVWVVADRLWR